MARPRGPIRPKWRSSEGCYYATIGERTLSLKVRNRQDYALAVESLRTLLRELNLTRLGEPAPHPTSPGASHATVAEAAAAFLAHAERRHAAGKLTRAALRNYRLACKHLAADLGGRQLATLTADDLEGWAARPGWSNSYQHGVLGVVSSVLKRAKHQLDRPLERPPMESRGADSCLTDEQFALVLEKLYLKGGKAKGDLRELLCFLRETGFRPGEAAGLTAAAVDLAAATVTLEKHKRRHKTGRPEVRVVNAAALAILAAQAGRYPTGPLFRTRGGGKAYGPNVVVKQLLRVSGRVGFRVVAYGLGRHAFVTRALVNGVSEPVVAALVGTSTQMIRSHYGHVGGELAALRAAAEKATTRAAG